MGACYSALSPWDPKVLQRTSNNVVRVGRWPDMSREEEGTGRLLTFYISCVRLFSSHVWSEGTDNRLVKTGGEADPNFTPKYIMYSLT